MLPLPKTTLPQNCSDLIASHCTVQISECSVNNLSYRKEYYTRSSYQWLLQGESLEKAQFLVNKYLFFSDFIDRFLIIFRFFFFSFLNQSKIKTNILSCLKIKILIINFPKGHLGGFFFYFYFVHPFYDASTPFGLYWLILMSTNDIILLEKTLLFTMTLYGHCGKCRLVR